MLSADTADLAVNLGETLGALRVRKASPDPTIGASLLIGNRRYRVSV